MTAPRPSASLAAVIAVAALLAPATASADPASAEALFREGRRLLEEGKTDEACQTLAESLAQDPSSGTLLNLGLCHEVQHRLATAWFDYVATAQLARDQGRPDRAAVAEKKATEIAPRLPYLTVTAIAPVPGLQIARGDQRLAPGVLGSAVPLDPGSYVVTASAPGYRAWKTTVDVAEAESKIVQVPELEPEAAPLPLPLCPYRLRPPSLRSRRSLRRRPRSPPATGGHALGWIIGGTGVAALAVGAGFGLASLSSYHDANALCPSHQECFNDALSARSSATSKAWISNVAFGVGVVGVGIGAWILLTGRRGEPATRVAVRSTPDAQGMRVSVERSF